MSAEQAREAARQQREEWEARSKNFAEVAEWITFLSPSCVAMREKYPDCGMWAKGFLGECPPSKPGFLPGVEQAIGLECRCPATRYGILVRHADDCPVPEHIKAKLPPDVRR